jgi:putative transposase
MSHNPLHKSFKTVRLRHHRYDEPGAYSLTIVAHNRNSLFGEIIEGEMCLNNLGEIVREEWLRSAQVRPAFELDAFVIMPNHVHGIVMLNESARSAERIESARSAALQEGTCREIQTKSARSAALPLRNKNERSPASISSFVAGFKAAVTSRIRALLKEPGFQVWQPRFHDHVIRADDDLQAIREYINNNPQQWNLDRENPEFKP